MKRYKVRILQAHAMGAFKPGQVTWVTITHARDCRRPSGGTCTCAPDITAEGSGGIQDIDEAGNPSHPHRSRS